MKKSTKIIGSLILIILLVGAGLFWFKFYFVFGDGVKAGELNQIVHKGIIFKTYEGRVIQSGLKGSKGSAAIESNTFEFSVEDKEVADKLMRCSGKTVELHYKEYKGAIPWRGMQKYIVDEIVSVE